MYSKINDGNESESIRARTEKLIGEQKLLPHPLKNRLAGRYKVNDSQYRAAVIANVGRLQIYLEFECRDRSMPQDIAQNVILKALKLEKSFIYNPESGSYVGGVWAWMKALAIFEMRSMLRIERFRRRREFRAYRTTYVSHTTEAGIAAAQDMEKLMTMLRKKEQRVIRLIAEGFSQPEVCLKTKLSAYRVAKILKAVRESEIGKEIRKG